MTPADARSPCSRMMAPLTRPSTPTFSPPGEWGGPFFASKPESILASAEGDPSVNADQRFPLIAVVPVSSGGVGNCVRRSASTSVSRLGSDSARRQHGAHRRLIDAGTLIGADEHVVGPGRQILPAG